MKKIAIIGGGISGLYIASLLRQNSNYEITVYEKNNSVNLEKGYGIQLSVNSIKLFGSLFFKKSIKVNLCRVVYLSLVSLKADIFKSHILSLFFKE